jgi:hypothetical protein
MQSKLDCELDELLDETNALLASATLNVRRTAELIGKLRTCADEAHDSGLADNARRLRKAADELEKRLMAL